MSATGGVRRGGRGARTLTTTALAVALCWGPSVWATAAPVDDPAGQGAGAAPAAPADPGAPAPAPVGDGQGNGNGTVPAPAPTPAPGGVGFGFAGGPAGDAVFAQLPEDPAYPVPAPPENDHLPAEVDESPGFQQQLSCDPDSRPGVIAFALLVTEHYSRPAFSGARPCIDYASEHHEGRALDWALNAGDPYDRRIGDAAVAWLTENDGEMMRRFGIEYIIWNRMVFHLEDNRWRQYTGTPHVDHVHFSFTWDGAQMRTSWWTGVAVTRPDLGPCDTVARQYAALHTFPRLEACAAPAVAAPETGLARVRPGESGPGVGMLQQLLGVKVTGTLDPATREALIAWQEEQGIPATGVADAMSYAAAQGWELGEVPEQALAVQPKDWQVTAFTPYLRTTVTQGEEGEDVAVLQEAIGAEPDGVFGPKTAEALGEWEQTVPVLAEQAARRAEGDPAVVTPLTWLLLERAVHPTLALRDIELAEGSRDIEADPAGELAARASAEGAAHSPYAGGAVAALQTLLDVEVDGAFGPITAQAVRDAQEAAELEPTGIVDGATWAAIEAQAIEAGLVPGAPGLEAQKAREKAEQEAAEKAEQERQEHEASVADADR